MDDLMATGIVVPVLGEEGTTDLAFALAEAAARVALALDKQWLGCRKLILKGRSRQGVPFRQQRLFIKPCSNLAALKGETEKLWQQLELTEPPRELSLQAGDLEPGGMEQLRLFTPPTRQVKEDQLAQLLSRLRRYYPARLLDRASHQVRNRREEMLAFYDPWRFQK